MESVSLDIEFRFLLPRNVTKTADTKLGPRSIIMIGSATDDTKESERQDGGEMESDVDGIAPLSRTRISAR